MEEIIQGYFTKGCPDCGQRDEFRVRYMNGVIGYVYLLDEETLTWGPKIELTCESIFCPDCDWEEVLQ